MAGISTETGIERRQRRAAACEPGNARCRQGRLGRMLLSTDRDADSRGPHHDEKDTDHSGNAGTEAS